MIQNFEFKNDSQSVLQMQNNLWATSMWTVRIPLDRIDCRRFWQDMLLMNFSSMIIEFSCAKASKNWLLVIIFGNFTGSSMQTISDAKIV